MAATETARAAADAGKRDDVLSDGGEMGALMRARDWRQTGLGDPDGWPQPLRTAIRLMLTAHHPIYILWGPDLRCFYNDAYRQSLPPDRHPASLGQPARMVWDGMWAVIGPQIEHVMAGGATGHDQQPVPITHDDRREDIHWTYSASPIDDPTARDGVGGVFVLCQETTASMVAERRHIASAQALRESEEQLRLATDAADIGLWDLDVVSDTLYWPPRVKAMFGISPDVPISMADYYAGLHPDDHAETSAAFAAALDPVRRPLYDVEYRAIGKEDGVVRWIAAKGRALFADDRPVRVIGTAIDITRRKANEARLRELNETLERRVATAIQDRTEAAERLRQAQKIDALGQLTGGVAHDFNNLLMVIAGGLSLLERRTDPAQRRQIVDGMRHAAERGASLSRQLLAFARRQPLAPEAVDLAQDIEGMRALLDRTLRGDVQVETRLADDLWTVFVDRAEFELVLLNLCVNARDAMPDGGTIHLAAENAAAIEAGELSGDFVRLRVSDNGTGMTPEVLSRVFEPFFTTKAVGAGSGLGLPQVYGFARQSGGTVRIESTDGVGTTVILLLPRSERRPSGVTRPIVDPTAGQIEPRATGAILLVEDDDEVAALVREMLRELGYRVTRAASAAAALGALADDRPVDIMFSDVMMPGDMNGLDLAREVRRRRPGLPILLTSGYADASIREASAEGIEVLPKPYDLATLHAAIEAARAVPR